MIDAKGTLAISVALAGLISTSPCLAQPTIEERTVAEALFREAKKRMTAGELDAACSKFEESHRLDPLPGVLLNLAVCHEKQGRTATAWSEFQQSLGQAKIDDRVDREELAAERIAALEPRLIRLTVKVAPETAALEGLIVSRDETTLSRAVWGVGIPVRSGRPRDRGPRAWSSRV